MLTLSQASTFFDLTPVYDATGASLLFHCQLENYDDSRRDASTANRRIMSVSPEVEIPAEKAVQILGSVWIVGQAHADGLDEQHRVKYVVSPAEDQFGLYTLGQFLAGSPQAVVWGTASWARDVKQVESSSTLPQMYEVSTAVRVPLRSILSGSSGTYLVLSPREGASDIPLAYSLLLDKPAEDVYVLDRVYDPVVGEYRLRSDKRTKGLRVRWQNLFDYGSQADARFQEGDLSVVLPVASGVATASMLIFDDLVYKVLAVDDLPDSSLVHCRVFGTAGDDYGSFAPVQPAVPGTPANSDTDVGWFGFPNVEIITTKPLPISGGIAALPTRPVGDVIWGMAVVYLGVTTDDLDPMGGLLPEGVYTIEEHTVKTEGKTIVFGQDVIDGSYAVVSYLTVVTA